MEHAVNAGNIPLPHWRRALTSVLPLWAGFVLTCFLWGSALESFPRPLQLPEYHGTGWAQNLSHGDAFANLMIADYGYGIQGRVDLQSSVRYPVFPMLTRYFSLMTGLSGAVSLFWVSQLALLVGLIGLWLLVEHLHDPTYADRAVMYMLFPLIGSGYTWVLSFPEPLHLLTWTLGFYFILRREFYLCALVTIIGVWTRPQAILILIPYAYILRDGLRRGEYDNFMDQRLWRDGLFVGVIPFALHSAWILHVSNLTQLPFSPITAQAAYGRDELIAPWLTVIERFNGIFSGGDFFIRPEIFYETAQVILILILVAVLIALMLRQRVHPAVVIFSVLTVLLGLSSSLFAIGRFALLTWIPITFIYLVPRRYDVYVLPVGVFLNFLMTALLTTSPLWAYRA